MTNAQNPNEEGNAAKFAWLSTPEKVVDIR
jgi:hypothetical protein